MFCHKCGTQIAEGAAFCHKCGTKVVYEDTDPHPVDTPVSGTELAAPDSPTAVTIARPRSQAASMVDGETNQNEQSGMSIAETGTAIEAFDVTLCTFADERKIRVIEAIRTWTGLSLKEAKELTESVPAVLKRAVTREEARLAKQMFTKVGATVSFTNQRGELEDIDPQSADTLESAEFGTDSKSRLSSPQSVQQSPLAQDIAAQNGPSKFKSWWDSCPKPKKILTTLGALLVGAVALSLLVSFLREFGYLLFGIAVIGGFIITLTTGSEKEKIETRKAIVQMVVGLGIVIVISLVVVLKPDFVSNIFQPGATVRNAYLTQYSETVTIEDAFDNFFSNEKWNTYESEGYSYVVFTGVCEYMEEPADVRVVFKVTGEKFRVDSLDINGEQQNDLLLSLMLAKIYEEY